MDSRPRSPQQTALMLTLGAGQLGVAWGSGAPPDDGGGTAHARPPAAVLLGAFRAGGGVAIIVMAGMDRVLRPQAS